MSDCSRLSAEWRLFRPSCFRGSVLEYTEGDEHADDESGDDDDDDDKEEED